ncbi:hypothetical protein C5167_034644 [Papaver somniferum]|uniref:Ribosomal protein S9 n=1 Tax=Papaver somniferum TaxID=3469 RepID=A0A4Y7KHN0_PAPSO|nr:hypothetical protein C5167_034644 [Papaver somniferum]
MPVISCVHLNKEYQIYKRILSMCNTKKKKKKTENDVFDLGLEEVRNQEQLQLLDDGKEMDENEKAVANELLEIEKKGLLQQLNGVDGLHLLSELKYMPKNEKNARKSTDAERRKQEEVAKARVGQVDDKGRAYGTGRRKCSKARVWVQPGDGRFSIKSMTNHLTFIFLFLTIVRLSLDHFLRQRPSGFGMSNVLCKAVVSQVKLEPYSWVSVEPCKTASLAYVHTLKLGFLTRDSRVVERKKPGKAKARKSFQWVKR